MRRMIVQLAFLGLVTSFVTLASGQPPTTPAAGGQPAGGQTAPAQGGAQALTPAAAAVAPDQLWRDTQILWTASRLSVSAEQAKQIVPYLSQLQVQLETSRKSRQELWQQSGQTVTRVVGELIAGQQPDAQVKASADDIANKAAATTAQDESATSVALAGVYQLLTAEQTALLETPQETTQRAEDELRYEGAPSLADYIVRQIQAQRALMPDEYVLLRVAEAARVAQRLVDPREPQYLEVEDAVLRLFDQISNWTDEQLATALPGLPDTIRQFLALTDDAPLKAIGYQAFRDWLKDPRTAKYLAIYGTAAQPLPSEEALPEGDLQTALNRAKIVLLLNDLSFDTQQLAQLLALVGGAKTEAQKATTSKDALLASVSPQLTQLLPYLITDQQLNEQWNSYLTTLVTKLKEPDDVLDQAMTTYVDAVERIMSERQAANVDWRVPPPVAGNQTAGQRAIRKRQEAAMIADAIELSEFLRPLDQATFNMLRPGRVEDFLAQYMAPGTQEYVQARDKLFTQVLEVRGLSREEWADVAPEVATRMLQTAGQLRETQWTQSKLPLDWYAIRSLLLAPETEDVLRQMIAARGAR